MCGASECPVPSIAPCSEDHVVLGLHSHWGGHESEGERNEAEPQLRAGKSPGTARRSVVRVIEGQGHFSDGQREGHQEVPEEEDCEVGGSAPGWPRSWVLPKGRCQEQQALRRCWNAGIRSNSMGPALLSSQGSSVKLKECNLATVRRQARVVAGRLEEAMPQA